jgi:hypothetical protein
VLHVIIVFRSTAAYTGERYNLSCEIEQNIAVWQLAMAYIPSAKFETQHEALNRARAALDKVDTIIYQGTRIQICNMFIKRI